MTNPIIVSECEKFEGLLYEFADSVTDRDGNVDSIGSSGFNIASESSKSFLTSSLERVLAEKDREIVEMVKKMKIDLPSDGINSFGENRDFWKGHNCAVDDILSKLSK